MSGSLISQQESYWNYQKLKRSEQIINQNSNQLTISYRRSTGQVSFEKRKLNIKWNKCKRKWRRTTGTKVHPSSRPPAGSLRAQPEVQIWGRWDNIVRSRHRKPTINRPTAAFEIKCPLIGSIIARLNRSVLPGRPPPAEQDKVL